LTWKRGLLVLLAVATIAIFLVIAFVGVLTAPYGYLRRLHPPGRQPVSLYLKDEATRSDVNALRHALDAQPEVLQVTYVSKAQALQRFKNEMKQSPEIVNNLDRNPLPASLDVRFQPWASADDKQRVLRRAVGRAVFRSLIDTRTIERWLSTDGG
jgi:cell division protein FtsX